MILKEFLHYRLLEKIGEGGMGRVYSALDTHLDRLVAVKVLHPDAVADPDRRQRFIQEAKIASALHHPNIVIVHDITQDKGEDFIVMEYVQGRTLDEVIGPKGIKLGEALGYAVQVADGLARAHSAGIVHRDLKPRNIIITEDGQAKILDFGLAKLMAGPVLPHDGTTLKYPEPDKLEAEEEFIVGTAAYMSPEQAEGRPIDDRSDIFAFGALLYEMLTAVKAFQRDTPAATLNAVIQEEVRPASSIVASLPAAVDQIIARCLRKDPQRRWQSMSDLKVVLQDLKADSDSGKLRTAAIAPAAPVPKKRLMSLVAGGACVVAAALIAWQVFFKKPPPPPEFDITRLTFESGAVMGSAVSPDGKMFAFASDRAGNGDTDIWVQQVSGEEPLRLTDDPANDSGPCFSPDGSKVAFHSDREGGGIYVVDTLGGQARRVADKGYNPKYSPDGAWISYVIIPATLETPQCGMYIVPSQGGTPRPFHPEFAAAGLGLVPSVLWSPDGKYLLFYGRRLDDPQSLDWWVGSFEGESVVRTNVLRDLALISVWRLPYAWTRDYVYYSTGTTVEGVNIFRVRLRPKTFQVSGRPERVTSGAGTQYLASATLDGRIVFCNMTYSANIWSLAADPDRRTVSGIPVALTRDLMAKFNPTVCADGSRVAFESFGGVQVAKDEMRVMDLATGRERAFPSRGKPFMDGVLSPDGLTFFYTENLADGPRTFVAKENESAGREVCLGCRVRDVSSDSRWVVVSEGSQKLSSIVLGLGQKRPLLDVGQGSIGNCALSPDDRWLAYVLHRPDGSPAIRVVPVGQGPYSEQDGVLIYESPYFLGSPQWSPDGRILYFLSEQDGHCCVWGVPLEAATKRPAGDVFALYHAHDAVRQLNVPAGDARLGVARNKIILYMATVGGNIYIAAPVARR